MSDVTLRFTADGSELRSEIDSDLKALQAFARVADAGNQTAVNAFRQQVAAQRELMQSVGATTEQMMKLDAMERKFEVSVNRVAVAQQKAAIAAAETPRSMRTGADGLIVMAFAATGATHSLESATVAAGALAYSIASVSKNAKIAASASGIGALFALLGLLVEKAIEAKHALEDIPEGQLTDLQKTHIDNLHTIAQVDKEIATARIQQQQSIDETRKRGDTDHLQNAVNIDARITALYTKRADLLKKQHGDETAAAKKAAAELAQQQKQAGDMSKSLANAVLLLSERNDDAFTKRKMQAERQYTDDVAHINALTKLSEKQHNELQQQAFERKKATLDQIDEEKAALNQQASLQVAMGGDDWTKAHKARLAMIELERKKNIQAGMDEANANAIAQQQITADTRERFDNAEALYQHLSQAAILHGTIVGRAMAVAAKAIAIYQMIPQAKNDMQMGKSEFAAALKAFATPGEQPLGAMHMLASGAYFAAAAFGLAEAGGLGGGGGGGAGGGGGGGSSGGASGPQPSSQLTGASLGAGRGQDTIKIEFVVIQKDAQGHEVSRVRQQIQRLEDRNQPIRMSA